ncbi:pseudouridine synthase [Acinetobacter sp. WCHAc060042]|uniref:pseudouridine synthase n=1 Tax=Acinetobacter sp. WCHAc060042 TaxID=2213016 RepID=UPI001BC88C97|nr:pseudouridine synthase [Acinetobacter sp. WCHAc060042]
MSNHQTSEFCPPMLNGVSASKVYLPKLQPMPKSIFAYLCAQFQHIGAAEWRQRFHDGLVYDAVGNVLSTDSAYLENQHVFYYRFLAREIEVPFQHEILFENDHFLVVNKPHFLTISPTGQYVQQTLLVRLKQQTGIEHLTPIHRLDRETAGLVLFSKRIETRGAYQQMFAERRVQKTYHAIAPFNPELNFPRTVRLHMQKGEPFYTMRVLDKAPNSETDISLLEYDSTWAKYELKPHTGKQHQLRVHLNSLSCPIKNDPFYPKVVHKTDDDFSQPLQLLAKKLSFKDPITQQLMLFNSHFELTL